MNAHARLAPALPLPLLRSEDAGVVTLALDRPASRNALSDAMMAALQEALDAVAADRSVKAVVLAANGPAFSAGHDLKEVTARRADPDSGTAYFADLFARCARLMTTIVELPQPVIAAVEGVATAAGCQLVASCDLAVAGADARFGTPGVNIGLFCSTPMVALSRNVARKHAMEMLLLGDLVPAEHALRIGLVNRVVPAGEALATAQALARQIAGKSARVVRVGKRAFYEQAELDLAAAYAHTARVMTQNMLLPDAAEGIGAFVEKREAVWPDEPA
ncbi:MAG: enoyl-CoA hydratase [Methylobacteriaceae bacterium]|nr:enoyl-CoA hydratase [Methylobacteriaceae bacterium]